MENYAHRFDSIHTNANDIQQTKEEKKHCNETSRVENWPIFDEFDSFYTTHFGWFYDYLAIRL